jgi:hypothetical protein
MSGSLGIWQTVDDHDPKDDSTIRFPHFDKR